MDRREKGVKRTLSRLGLGILAFLFVFGLVGGTVLIIQATGKLPPRPDRKVDARIAEMALTAPCAILVMRRKNVVYEKGWPEGTPADISFSLGEFMEQWIAEAIMMLHDQGKLDLDEPLGRYLPEQASLTPSHTVANYLDYSNQNFRDEEPDQALERDQKNYQILWQVIRAVSGEEPQVFIQNQILDPLGMSATTFSQGTPQDENGPGQWHSNLADMTRWANSLNSNQLVHMKTYLRGHSPRMRDDGKKSPFGFGWQLRPWHGLRLEQATSLSDNANYAVTRLPQKNFTVMVFSQMKPSQFDSAALGREIAKVYLEREFAKAYRQRQTTP